MPKKKDIHTKANPGVVAKKSRQNCESPSDGIQLLKLPRELLLLVLQCLDPRQAPHNVTGQNNPNNLNALINEQMDVPIYNASFQRLFYSIQFAY